jgi:transcriptional regulator with XRE-family HTH domain
MAKGTTTVMRRLRRDRELTLEALHLATGVHQSTLSKLERGLIQPSEPQANALAGYFGRPIGVLLSHPNIAA